LNKKTKQKMKKKLQSFTSNAYNSLILHISRLSSLSDTSFHFMKNLRMLEMHDNTIDDLKKGTFQGDIHVKLEEASFAFNNIKQISQHTFVDLEVNCNALKLKNYFSNPRLQFSGAPQNSFERQQNWKARTQGIYEFGQIELS
jgi:hypothetical protein